MARNDITGDVIKSRPPTQQYRDNYDEIYKKKPMKPKLVTATWCGPCKLLKDQLERTGQLEKIDLVDVDEDREISTKYNIRSVPSLIVFYSDGGHKVYTGTENIVSIIKES